MAKTKNCAPNLPSTKPNIPSGDKRGSCPQT